ncbi:MAG TPA: hypothetical protein VG272_09185 [Candidatus Acidoferrales bacterium]|nr:hypothetical protein [Candidatus Acidoferrales bacterium]
MNIPPPATELMTPARRAAILSKRYELMCILNLQIYHFAPETPSRWLEANYYGVFLCFAQNRRPKKTDGLYEDRRLSRVHVV